MIYEKLSGESVAACDLCSDELEPVDGREAVRKAMEEAGFVRQWIDGILMDVCTECQEKQREEFSSAVDMVFAEVC